METPAGPPDRPSTADAASRLPATYRVQRELARSAMSVIFLVEEPALARRVVVKVLEPTIADDPTFRQRFTHEVGIAAALDHPNVIPIHAAGESSGLLYLAMRYVDGTDLSEELTARGPLQLDETVHLLGQVADALDAAHRAGLVHRDVKPGNVLIDRATRHVYLCDFGIAKRISGAGSLTGIGQFVGTVPYVAPEQIQGRPTDGRADVYALGVVAFRCLAGALPFEGNEPAVLYAHLFEPPPRASTRRSGLPPHIDRAIVRAMAKEPGARHGTCRQFIDELRFGEVSTEPRRWWYRRPVVLAVAAGVVVAAALLVVPRLPGIGLPAGDLERVPMALRSDCATAAVPLAGAARTLSCRDETGRTAVIGLFDDDAATEAAYRAELAAAPEVARASGDCGVATGAEHTQPGVGPSRGRLLCYKTDGAARLVWSDRVARTVAVVERSDGNDLALYQGWASWVRLPAYPAAEEAAVVAAAPESCRRAAASSYDRFVGVVAVLECAPIGTGARTLRYTRFADLDALTRAYGGLAAAAKAPDVPDCGHGSAPGFLGSSEYSREGRAAGRVLCHPEPRAGFAVAWATDSLLLLGEAVGPDAAALAAWWSIEAGPRTDATVDAINQLAKPAFPTDAEEALIDRIPDVSRVRCSRTDAELVRDRKSVLASVTCGTANPDVLSVTYAQFADQQSMLDDFGPPAEPAVDCTTLPPGFTGEAAYRRADGATGQLFCTIIETSAYLQWSDLRHNITAYADVGVGEEAAIVEWWRNQAGPL